VDLPFRVNRIKAHEITRHTSCVSVATDAALRTDRQTDVQTGRRLAAADRSCGLSVFDCRPAQREQPICI
jgi:hypothetical protein